MHEQSYPQNPVQHPGGGYAPAGGPEPRRSHVGAIVAISAVVALILVAGGLALFGPFRTVSTTEASSATDAALRSAQTSTSLGQTPTNGEDPQDPTSGGPVQDPTGNPTPVGNPNGSPQPSGPSAPSGPSGPSNPSAPAPVITSFVTPDSIDCHNGDFQMFSASWTTTNATKTMISIDGPGGYKTYGPNDSDSLPFSCSSPHTFLLTAYGQDGATVTRSITLQPRNAQMPESSPEADTDTDADTQGGGAPAPADEDEI